MTSEVPRSVFPTGLRFLTKHPSGNETWSNQIVYSFHHQTSPVLKGADKIHFELFLLRISQWIINRLIILIPKNYSRSFLGFK